MPVGASSMPAADAMPGEVYGIPNARGNGSTFASRGILAAIPHRSKPL